MHRAIRDRLAYITQTTLSVDDTAAIVAALVARFPGIVGPAKEDICYATTNRQAAVKAIAPRIGALLVIGAPNSSNSQRLVEVGRAAGCAYAQLVQRAGDIDWRALGELRAVGVTAGASAPEVLVNEVIDAFRARFDVTVEIVETAQENIEFKVPKALREQRMSDPDTIRFYDDQTAAYLKVSQRFSDPRLAGLIARLAPGAAVLDLGCGPGRDALQLQQAGLEVTAMDASAEMIRQVSMIDGVTPRLAEFGALDDVAAFDAVWANFSLLHAPRSDFPAHLAAIARALRPGGLFVLAMKTGTGEGRDRLGRFYTYYGADELQGLLRAAGFTVEDVQAGTSRGMAGTDDPYVSITARA